MSTEEHSGHTGEGSKHLKGLPKIQASPDFEARLQRRIAEEVKAGTGSGSPRWIPALAYSAATVVVLSIISYYAFFRSGVVPASGPIVAEETLRNNATPSAPASPDQTEPLHSLAKLEDRNVVQDKDVRGKKEPVENNGPRGTSPMAGRIDKQQESRRKAAAAKNDRIKDEAEIAGREEGIAEVPAPVKEGSKIGKPANIAAAPSTEKPAEAAPLSLLSVESAASAPDSATTAPSVAHSAGAVPPGVMYNSKARSSVQSAAAAPESTGADLVAESESAAKKEAEKIKAWSALGETMSLKTSASEKQISIDRQLELVTHQIDSLAVKDSVKLDSLRRLQRYLQRQKYLQTQQQKIRKPD